MSSGEPSARRRSAASRRSLAELTLPADYLDRLEQRRKQLDESIHKFIASKEREYKVFEKELRQEHKLSQGQHASDTVPRGLAGGGGSNEQSEALASHQIAAIDALSIHANRPSPGSPRIGSGLPRGSPSSADRSKAAVSQDQGPSYERPKYLDGVFMPAYLSALDVEHEAKRRLERASSEPPLPITTDEAETAPLMLERANSDSLQQAKQQRPTQFALAKRTSSSDASVDGKLASALRSPTQRARQKRVSLAVGDVIVAPSDNVPPALTHNTTPSHSRRRSQIPERDAPVSGKRIVGSDGQLTSMPRTTSPLADGLLANGTADEGDGLPELPPAAVPSSPSIATKPPSRGSKIDPDGDLFDLEHEEDSEGSAFDDPDEVLETEDEDDDDNDHENEITGRLEPQHRSISPPTATTKIVPASSLMRTRYDATAGLIPEPEDEEEDSAVPHLAFGSTSSVAPLEPGFRRPSVIRDPIYAGADYRAAEQDAVERDVYGSSANRPSSKGSFTAGSLGESFMAQHAEGMMRVRLARAQQLGTQTQTQVRS